MNDLKAEELKPEFSVDARKEFEKEWGCLSKPAQFAGVGVSIIDNAEAWRLFNRGVEFGARDTRPIPAIETEEEKGVLAKVVQLKVIQERYIFDFHGNIVGEVNASAEFSDNQESVLASMLVKAFNERYKAKE